MLLAEYVADVYGGCGLEFAFAAVCFAGAGAGVVFGLGFAFVFGRHGCGVVGWRGDVEARVMRMGKIRDATVAIDEDVSGTRIESDW